MKFFRIFIIALPSLFAFPFPVFSEPMSTTHFMGSSMIFMPSTEDIGKKNLVFRFNHRFGNAKTGFENFFGLDDGANTQLSLDYGITDRLSVGVARTSQYKTWEARTKFKIVSQNDGFPLTISLFGVLGQETTDQSLTFNYYNRAWTGQSVIDNKINKDLNTYELSDSDKRSYMASLLISRKFTERISLQISPLFVHRNFAPYQIANDRAGLEIGGRIKITNRFDITFDSLLAPHRDYFGDNYATESQKTKLSGITQYTSDQINQGLANGSITLADVFARNIVLNEPVKHRFVPFALGFDLETGGHVFQVFVSNTRALAHTQLLRGGDYDYFKQEFCLGFNIMRQFYLGEEKEKW
ncbi:DUF5777 family beta-barrel protein [Leptospira idonii]|uniref:DUF5777 domain-containing protein n=1 Tax=Leptospira idonii TaxID=1193500 RepID=A0A4V3JY47_9LEPT|nr:DUF5777 family beta-barrel protein [Leptospira idonii]TGN18496.1 hypothetical protein EHS15_13985 [Leptospira idonii]